MHKRKILQLISTIFCLVIIYFTVLSLVWPTIGIIVGDRPGNIFVPLDVYLSPAIKVVMVVTLTVAITLFVLCVCFLTTPGKENKTRTGNNLLLVIIITLSCLFVGLFVLSLAFYYNIENTLAIRLIILTILALTNIPMVVVSFTITDNPKATAEKNTFKLRVKVAAMKQLLQAEIITQKDFNKAVVHHIKSTH